jgi:hypothetical protein
MSKSDFVVDNATNELKPIPTYHWSEIASPRYKDLNRALLFEPVTITQNVHLSNQTPKTTKSQPALVIYDAEFVKYKLLEVVAPFLSEYLDTEYSDLNATKDSSDVNDVLASTLVKALTPLLLAALSNAAIVQVKTATDCQDIGVDIGNDSSTIVRSVKSAIARKYKLSQAFAPF